MNSLLTYMPFISVAIVAGLLIMALLNFSTLRKSMQSQSEQQTKHLTGGDREWDGWKKSEQ